MRCSCGQRVATCEFWQPAVAALLAQPQADLIDRYRILFDTFQSLYGPRYQIVDSSKCLGQLRRVISLPNVDLKVVHLLKDVRGFTVSQRDATDPEIKYHHLPVLFGSVSFSRWVFLHTMKTPGYLFWKWYLRNLATLRLLRSSGVAHLRVGYDELAQKPQIILPKIYEFLGLESPTNIALAPKETNSHAFMGNPMLGDPEKTNAIRYDDRWQQRKDWHLAARLFPHILAFNHREVYSNNVAPSS